LRRRIVAAGRTSSEALVEAALASHLSPDGADRLDGGAGCELSSVAGVSCAKTEKLPLKRWFDMARTMEERSEVVAVAQFPVQPWLDVPEYGWSAIVVTDNDKPLAEKLAADLAQAAWDQRREFVVNNPGPGEAIRMAVHEEGLRKRAEREKVEFGPDLAVQSVYEISEPLEKLRLAKDLLRHAVPSGDEAVIFDRALTALLSDLAQKRFAASERPRPAPPSRPGSRTIPAELKRRVWLRDLGRCAFVAATGRRCTERAFLEFHHVEPYALGGEATLANIQLRCRSHNAYEARLWFGNGHGNGAGSVREERAPYGEPTRSGTSGSTEWPPGPAP
jgi:hypothetical protein